MKFKKIFVGLACFGLMSFCTLPVHAENNAAPVHAHVYVGTGNFFSALTGSYNVGTHTVAIMQECKCSCGSMSSIEVRREERGHKPVFKSISNNHASPGIHHFRGECECGFTTTAMLDCPGGNNHVSAP